MEEAIRLFTVSTVEAINSGEVGTSLQVLIIAADHVPVLEEMNDTVRAELDNIERLIKRRLAIGSKVSEKKLIEGLSRSVSVTRAVPTLTPVSSKSIRSPFAAPCRSWSSAKSSSTARSASSCTASTRLYTAICLYMVTVSSCIYGDVLSHELYSKQRLIATVSARASSAA